MFSALFKKPKPDAQATATLRQSEDALQLRMNRMVRQNLRVITTPPPLHAPMTATSAIAKALRQST